MTQLTKLTKKIGLFVFFCLIGINAFADGIKHTPLSSKDLAGKIKASMTSLGGYTGPCMNFKITNLTAETLHLKLEPGRRLIADEEKFQDIFIVKEHLFTVAPNTTHSFVGNGFCSEAHDAGPAKGSTFQLGYIENKWVDVAEIISANYTSFSQYEIQAAVWSLSDDFNIHHIRDSESAAVKALKSAVIKANPQSDKIKPKTTLMNAEETLEDLKRRELSTRARLNWQPVGDKDVFDYKFIGKSTKGKWVDAKGMLSIVGREITVTDSLDSSLNYSLLMGEVKRDTIDFGEGNRMITDICIANRTDVVNDKKNYRFILNHLIGSDFYSATLSEWDSMKKLLNIKVEPIITGEE